MQRRTGHLCLRLCLCLCLCLRLALLLLCLRLLVQLDSKAVDLFLTQVRRCQRNGQLLLQCMQIGRRRGRCHGR